MPSKNDVSSGSFFGYWCNSCTVALENGFAFVIYIWSWVWAVLVISKRIIARLVPFVWDIVKNLRYLCVKSPEEYARETEDELLEKGYIVTRVPIQTLDGVRYEEYAQEPPPEEG